MAKTKVRFKASGDFSKVLLSSDNAVKALESVSGGGLPLQRTIMGYMQEQGISAELMKNYSRYRVMIGVGSNNPRYLGVIRGDKNLRKRIAGLL